ncbi:MAG: S41 family peptidase [Cyclobacteriaceae bacterium]|jgi:carboxyl-terminal processing protease|nr:S41 family peptidase [Flammeovirgaceae bacterium]MCZ8021562.1 S41 family peptidase [Cytophagales bacterium]MCZ8327845.1 S41 family peptidase [Cyclobacteriaceae bacterium]
MMKKKYFIPLVIIIVLLVVANTKPADRYFEIARNLDVFASLFKEVNNNYVDDVNPNTLMRTGIDAMLASLDPYTNYIPEDEIENFRTQNTGQYGGIGAVTRQFGNRTVVTLVMAGFAAEKGGLKAGDEVLKIDSKNLSSLTQEEAGNLMKGQLGTPVTLTVKRYGVDKPIELSFKRERIKISNVPHFTLLQSQTGYIQLTDFTPDAGKEVRNALIALKEKGAKNIVLDLRGNPGGLLQEAVNICNLFLPKGVTVVETKGKIKEHNVTYKTLNPPVDLEIPVAVLIDRGSASASEIVAGTLQDYDRAIIVGEKSFGKGLVQINRDIPYNSKLKVTTAKYYTPSGRCIQVLDYSQRRADGSVASIPDSLKRPFKTANGRTVYDGGGIDPDIALPNKELHPIIQTLFLSGYFVDYATQYTYTHVAPASPTGFALTDAEYAQFVTWMKGKPYAYRTDTDLALQELKEQAKTEQNIQVVQPELDKIEGILTERKKNDLIVYKSEIKQFLETEILTHYFAEKGNVEAGFSYDTELLHTVGLLKDTERCKQILARR